MASASLRFYPTANEAAEIEANAESAGVSVSEYVKRQLDECETDD